MGTSKSKILIITSRTGGGHMSLSHALAEMLSEKYETTIVDPYQSIIRLYYTWVGRHSLPLWGLGYKSSDNEKAALRLHKMLTLLVQKRLVALIEQIKPGLIITTHTLLSYEGARAIEQSGQSIPLVFQFSELERIHATWVSERNADAYLVPTREIYAQTQEQGIDPNHLYLPACPYVSSFYRTTAQASMKHSSLSLSTLQCLPFFYKEAPRELLASNGPWIVYWPRTDLCKSSWQPAQINNWPLVFWASVV